MIQPRVIRTLGNFSTKLLTANPTGITKVRGAPQEQMIGGRHLLSLLPLFHPAAGVRTPRVAEQLRQDFRQIPDLLGTHHALREPRTLVIPVGLAVSSLVEKLPSVPITRGWISST